MTDKDLARFLSHSQNKSSKDFARLGDIDGGETEGKTIVSFDSISHHQEGDETITLVRATFSDGTTHDFDIHTKNGSSLDDLELIVDGNYVTSKDAFPAGAHLHVLFEVETAGAHAGADFVLHPYNGSVCNVCFRLLINGEFVDGFANLNEINKVHISFNGLPSAITNVTAHYTIL